MEQSAVVMKAMGDLVKVADVNKTMMEMSKEMMKVSITVGKHNCELFDEGKHNCRRFDEGMHNWGLFDEGKHNWGLLEYTVRRDAS